MQQLLNQELQEHLNAFQNCDFKELIACANDCINALKAGNKILIFGNGGSAADAQHFAAELCGRYLKERKALAAISLSTDTSALTAIGNDYGFECVFARQVQALANANDVCIGISTSGSSPNVLKALKTSKELGCTNWLFSSLRALASDNIANKPTEASGDFRLLVANHTATARIQEMHIFFIHCICALVDEAFKEDK